MTRISRLRPRDARVKADIRENYPSIYLGGILGGINNTKCVQHLIPW